MIGYISLQSRLSPPMDCTLPRHWMFRKTEDEKWEINLYVLFKNLPKPRGSRAYWYKTSLNMVQRLPTNMFRSEIREINAVLSLDIDKNTWFSARAALALLTYGSRNHRHLEIVQWVERYTGITLPRQKGLSRREVVFGHKLQAFVENELTNGDYEILPQYRVCNGKYYVDFAVKHYWNGNDDSTNYYLYFIEFDEEEHALTPNQAADFIRDKEIKKAFPHATIIRVKHNESDSWFDLVDSNNYLISYEMALLDGIITACRAVEDDVMIIDSASAKNAYDYHQNTNMDELTYDKQPLRGMKEALTRCNIHYYECRTKAQRQLKVSLESFAAVLCRWYSDRGANKILCNLKAR